MKGHFTSEKSVENTGENITKYSKNILPNSSSNYDFKFSKKPKPKTKTLTIERFFLKLIQTMFSNKILDLSHV